MQKGEREQTETEMEGGTEIGEILAPCWNTIRISFWEASDFFHIKVWRTEMADEKLSL